ncbi:lysylphosphatidylglycerol synthase domain-containing protein, partial [Pseudomonadota bacterium]
VEAVVFYLFGVGVGVEMSFVTYVLVVPMIYVAASLPLSIGGLGVREAAAVTLFMAVGMSEGDAGAVSFLYIPILLLASLPGLAYFMLLKNNKKYFEDATHSKISV